MRKLFLVLGLTLLVASGASAAEIYGNYIEARTASVYVGACFANSETNLNGQEAVLGWQVTNGSWKGTHLAGLSIVGVVRANATLGDPHGNPYPATSLLIVDQKATAEQAKALVGFARAQAPELFARVVRVDRAPIEFRVGEGHHAAGHEFHGTTATLVVGNVARIETRPIHEHTGTCANAERYYEPLTNVIQAEPALASTHEFKGEGLNATWTFSQRPSAYVGTFAR